MNSNIYATNQNDNKAKGFKKQPEMSELMVVADRTIKSTIDDKVEKYGEEKKFSILKQMLEPKYINSFKPKTPMVRKCVRTCISKYFKEEVIKILNETVKVGKQTVGLDEQEVLKQMEDSEYVRLAFGEDCTGDVEKIIKKTVSEFVQNKREELQNNNKQVENIYFGKTPEEIFYNKVKAYTNDFDFLAQDSSAYYSKGYNRKIKFDNFEEFSKFGRLQILVRHANKKVSNESAAIDMVIKNQKDNLSELDLKILNSRKNVLSKQDIDEDIDSDVYKRFIDWKNDRESEYER